MIIISLNRLKFFGYHGLYPGEKEKGGEFEVNIQLSFPESKKIERLHETIDYVKVFDIIKKRMEQSTELLESLSIDIADCIKTSFPQIVELSITIQKDKPPIQDFQGSVAVTYQKKY